MDEEYRCTQTFEDEPSSLLKTSTWSYHHHKSDSTAVSKGQSCAAPGRFLARHTPAARVSVRLAETQKCL